MHLVSDLIDPESRMWKSHALNAWFSLDESTTISNIPLCPTNCNDKLVWRLTSSGDYSVRSGRGWKIKLGAFSFYVFYFIIDSLTEIMAGSGFT